MKRIGFAGVLLILTIVPYACRTRHNTVAGKHSQLKVLDKKPEYPGGVKGISEFLSSHIVYPAQAIEQNKEGKVMVRFVIDTFGNVSNVSVLQPASPLLDDEAVRVVKMMNGWTPGIKDNEKVAVYYTLPVTFRLTNK